MIGHSLLNTSTSSSSLLSSIESSIKGDINSVVTDVTKRLGIHDFYSVHLLDYCEGYYTPTAVANSTSQPYKNVTKCSNQTGLFHFDPTTIVQNELRPGLTLQDLHWPSQIQDGLKTLEVASKVTVILYYVGIGTAGLAIIGSLVGIVADGVLSAVVNFMLALVRVSFQAYNSRGLPLMEPDCFPHTRSRFCYCHNPGCEGDEHHQSTRERYWNRSVQREQVLGDDMGSHRVDALGGDCMDRRLLYWKTAESYIYKGGKRTDVVKGGWMKVRLYLHTSEISLCFDTQTHAVSKLRVQYVGSSILMDVVCLYVLSSATT